MNIVLLINLFLFRYCHFSVLMDMIILNYHVCYRLRQMEPWMKFLVKLLNTLISSLHELLNAE